MTINQASRLVRTRQSEADSITSRFASDEEERDTVLGKIGAFIPTEIIAGWGAALGFISPNEESGKWLLFATALVVLLVVLLLDIAIKDKLERESDPHANPTSRQRKAKTFLIMGAAFSAWALASAGTPLSTEEARWALGAAVAVSLILPRVAKLWDVAPSS